MKANPSIYSTIKPNMFLLNEYKLHIAYKDLNKKLNDSKTFLTKFNSKTNNEDFNINIDDKDINFKEFIYDNSVNKDKAKADEKNLFEKYTNVINKIDAIEKQIDKYDEKKNINNSDINKVNNIVINNINNSDINKANNSNINKQINSNINNVNKSNININKVNNNDVNNVKNNDINNSIDKSGKFNDIINKYNNIEKGDSIQNINSK